MGFWGIEVKPGKPCPYHSDNVSGKLHVTQATLGSSSGSSKEKSTVQCTVGHKRPIFLCTLIPNKIESCPLNLEFEEEDLVAFSVIGPRSIHLSGYFLANEGHFRRDDYESDSFGEDIAETDTEDSSEFDTEDEYDDDFINDDDDFPEFYPPSPTTKSGVVIEEIVDDDKSTGVNDQSRQMKKNKSGDSEKIKNSQHQIVLKRNVEYAAIESEDEDGFPISTKSRGKPSIQKLEPEPEQEQQAKEKDGNDLEEVKEKDASSLKRKVESNEQVDGMERKKKKKQKKKVKEEKARKSGDDDNMGSKNQSKEAKDVDINLFSDGDGHGKQLSNPSDLEEKTKKKKKKKEKRETEVGPKVDEQIKMGDQNKSTSELNEKESKSSKVRTFANGLVIEDVAMGKPDGKRASPGNQVSVHYIGKLKNGKIFDSNMGRAPFKFRLGVGQVIKGWDVGVNGMRVGDKRRLTIPPSMGYGATSAGKIPPNSWLIFDVELVAVR